jgi:hypothetical protein
MHPGHEAAKGDTYEYVEQTHGQEIGWRAAVRFRIALLWYSRRNVR